MLLSLIAWIYISLICLIWGNMLLSPLSRVFPPSRYTPATPPSAPGAPPAPASAARPFFIPGASSASAPAIETFPDSSLLCLAGLAGIGGLTLCISLFMPLGLPAHLIMLTPALYYCRRPAHRRNICLQLKDLTGPFSLAGYCLLGACILMTLVISSYNILHPDTMNYHALAILLHQRSKPIPGLAALRIQLGFESAWFTSLAIFKTDTPGTFNMIFLNGAVLCWYFIFLVKKIGISKNYNGWLLLLAFTLLSYPLVRLTASSGTPDLIAAIYVWAAVHCFLQQEETKKEKNIGPGLVIIFSVAAVLIKFSTLAVLILPLAATVLAFRRGSLRTQLPYLLTAALLLLALFAHNVISSGYILYPSPHPDLFNVDWKMKISTIHNIDKFITSFARGTTDQEWIATWWSGLDLEVRVLFFGIITGALFYFPALWLRRFFGQKKSPFTPDKRSYVVGLMALTGSLLWLIGSPSPRFGFPYLIPLLCFLFAGWPAPAGKKVMGLRKILSGCLTAAIIAYTGYRLVYFFAPGQLLIPAGIDKTAYRPVENAGLKVDLLTGQIQAADSASRVYDNFGSDPVLRGHTVAEGFRDGE